MEAVQAAKETLSRRGSSVDELAENSTGESASGQTPVLSTSAAENKAAANAGNKSAFEAEPIHLISPRFENSADEENFVLTHDDGQFTTSGSASQRASVTTTSTPQHQAQESTPLDGDIIEVNSTGFQLPLDPNGKGKLKNRYVMPDGSVVNGKGLGRGRPGIKRGPRKSALSREVTETGETVSTPSPSAPARTVSGKRKRADSDVIRVADGDDSEDALSRESTPEYNPSASSQTRSGRQTQKPVPITLSTASNASPATKRPSLNQSKSSPSVKKHPKIKAKVYRGREQFALCEHCLRQHGPPGNAIVFCDACNKCWHQRCHDPKISKEVVTDTKAEWFCADCDRILHGKKKAKPPVTAVSKPMASAPTTVPVNVQEPTAVVPRYGLPLVPGMSLTFAQRKQYLTSLSKEKMIEIILQAANLAPNMPIFETPLHLIPQPQPQGYSIFIDPPASTASPHPPPPQTHPHSAAIPLHSPPPQTSTAALPTAHTMPPPPPPSQLPPHLHKQFTSTHPFTLSTTSIPSPDHRPIFTHPTAHMTSKPNTQPPPPNTTDEDEGYFDDFDEMALLYPKPGQGVYDLAMAPESSDLSIMLEGPESRTFSHWVRWRAPMTTGVDAA